VAGAADVADAVLKDKVAVDNNHSRLRQRHP
jgi:hypothetical protein